MKKILFAVLLGSNTYAGLFKLPTLKCTVTPSGEPSFVKFLILENFYKSNNLF
jgi:hypothetical protein